MASLWFEGKSFRIQFHDHHGIRRTLRLLPQLDKNGAHCFKRNLEALLASQTAGTPIPPPVATWLSKIGSSMYRRLVALGLVPPRTSLLVKTYLAQWLSERCQAGYQPTTIAACKAVVAELTRLLGNKALSALGPADAAQYLHTLRNRRLRPTTIQRRMALAKTIFADAVGKQYLLVNPFAGLKLPTRRSRRRQVYISTATVLQVLDACPDPYWRLLIALVRFGGLRIPSEVFSLRWQDIDWQSERILVPRPTTKKRGKIHRAIPIFERLKPYVEEAWDIAPDGAIWLFPENWRKQAQTPHGWKASHLESELKNILFKAGVEPWPGLWQSLRASCENDLAAHFPLPIVTQWLGHPPKLPFPHSAHPTDLAFQQTIAMDPFSPL